MKSVGTRELKQNPQAVVREVLAGGEPVEITAHGHPTGVRLVPDRPAKARWVSGTALSAIAPLSSAGAEELKRDLAELHADDEPQDPWERQ